ncbi:NAD(P)/FAD-dependent oxidoreductase [Bacillus sp. EAC]|uniref:phytoene desaturase family protein n=1 Tax=Bacillus sp. EAC TaxID=1978338 RepID=UPI000B433989|nr:NAD(P)/FAD-dependent oxidoreductase [Bacillus sp. EAC]
MTLDKKKYDASVIGGGLSGITAAIYLAKAGKSVIVFEKAKKLGGMAQTTNKDGALFNFGPHAMYEGGGALQILNELNCIPKGGYAPKGRLIGIWQGGVVQIPTDLSQEENIEWNKLMSGLGQVDTGSIQSINLMQWAKKHIFYDRVRLFFLAMCRQWSYCDNPSVLSAGFVIKQGQLAGQGVKYIDGGWQTVVDNLYGLAMEVGVTFATGCKVNKILHSSGTVRGLTLSDGNTVLTSSIIITAGPDEACRLVDGADQMSLGRWKNESRPLYAACLDVALNRLPNSEKAFALGLDQPLYFSIQSLSAKLSENGAHVIHVMKYNHNWSQTDPKEDKKQLTNLLDLLQPGWDKEIVSIRFLPKIMVAHDSRTIHHDGAGSAPGVFVPEVNGLYVAGDWVGIEGRLADAAMISAKLAAQEVINNLN